MINSAVVKSDYYREIYPVQQKIAQPKPFVKWVGGKRAIIDELLKRRPPEIKDYYEPFLGGGALFFELANQINNGYLSDLNADLIVAYQTIKDKPQELIELLKNHQEKHTKEYYYKIRALQELSDPLESSARFIYLMKTCFNGLYRVNKSNEFNTPIGSYQNPTICDVENIYAVNKALQVARINYQDFTKITPKSGDFVYFDPPYHPTSNNSFVSYVSNGFTEKDQIRLRDFALELTRSGINVMISNSDADFIFDIYKKSFNIQKVDAPRVVSCKADKRQSVSETLITNY